jgi:hypothetical protein
MGAPRRMYQQGLAGTSKIELTLNVAAREPLRRKPCIVRVSAFESTRGTPEVCTDVMVQVPLTQDGKLIEILLLRHRWCRYNGRLLGCDSRSVAPDAKMTAWLGTPRWLQLFYEPRRN